MTTMSVYGEVLETDTGVSDAQVAEYFTLVCADDDRVALRILSCRHSSPTLITRTLTSPNSARRASGHVVDHVTAQLATTEAQAVAAKNPATPLHQVIDWLRGGSTSRVALAAATNLALGERIPELFDTVGVRAANALLANRSIPEDFLIRHWRRSVSDALSNPVLPADLLHEYATRDHGVLLKFAAANPALPADLVVVALNDDDLSVRRAALRNPAMPTAELKRIAADRSSRAIDVSSALQALERRRWRADPLSVPTQRLGDLPFNDTVARHLDALDGDSYAAVAALVAAGFDGTAGELLEVATSITH